MKVYPLDPQFRSISRFKIPIVRELCAPVQAMMRAYPCLSDSKTHVRHVYVPGSAGNRIHTMIIEPKNAPDKLPCLYNIHGGGFILPAAPYHFALAKEYAVQANCRVVFPDYRLAPKYPFPAAADDCWAVYTWLLRDGGVYGIDTDRIVIGGDSAGGDLTAVVTQMARDRNVAMPKYQMLIYPVTDRRMQTESSKRFHDTPVWSTAASEKMWEFYLPTSDVENIAYASPLEAESLEGLPPAYVEVAEYDSLRDEGLAYAQRLKDAGVEVELFETHGTPHGFELVTSAPITQDAVAHRTEFLRKAFASC